MRFVLHGDKKVVFIFDLIIRIACYYIQKLKRTEKLPSCEQYKINKKCTHIHILLKCTVICILICTICLVLKKKKRKKVQIYPKVQIFGEN